MADSSKFYKFLDVKIYSSNEWMFNSSKKYRTVFEKEELTYVRAEFSFYNKLFDEVDWNTVLCLKVFDIGSGKRQEIASQDEEIDIDKSENIIYYRKGWGSETTGSFWNKGIYEWVGYIDNVEVGSRIFYVEDAGLVTFNKNPYFKLESVKLFSGPYEGWKITDRKYLKQFNRDTTPYIWLEIKIENKLKTAWQCEIFINFHNDAGMLKASMIIDSSIDKNSQGSIYTFDKGWGNDEPGSWVDDKYTAELVFMEQLIAVVPFNVGTKEIEGVPKMASKKAVTKVKSEPPMEEVPEKSLDELMLELDELIGLQNIKNQIRSHIQYLDFLKIRQSKGLDDAETISLHSVFTGNPGTGKTTVVKMLGKLYKHIGLLSNGEVHEVGRADLVGEFIGQTAPRTKKAIEDARGGILFIDEAYSLARDNDDKKDFGQEVLEVLLKELSDGPGDIAIMVAGYPREMQHFIESNPGLKSRFKHYFHFGDYSPDELMRIAHFAAEKRKVTLHKEAATYIEDLLMEGYRNRDRTFGNARYAYALVDEAKMNMGLRLMQLPNVKRLAAAKLSTIMPEDVLKIMVKNEKKQIEIKVDEDLLRESLAELNKLVGLLNIKNDINEMVKLVRYYRETGKDVLNRFSLHTVFRGNPGTGKTTVTRIIGKIYKALGLLERGHVVETDREGLVAGYIGQTAIKTKSRIDEAMGGVLFIDEAYALADKRSDSFGKEAIEVILKNMEDFRGQFAVIVAGYPENMDVFLRANPGLKSRFDRTFDYHDYSPDELLNIAVLMLNNENLTPNSDALSYLRFHFFKLHERRDKYFGNARQVRKVIEKAIKNQHLRMASMKPQERTLAAMETLIYEDVKEFTVEDNSRRKTIGFKLGL